MFGKPSSKTWTRLSKTAKAGDTSITLSEQVDWTVGAQIVIASTSLNPFDAETVNITGITQTAQGSVLTLSAPLSNSHSGVTETIGGKSISYQAEVGLLSRNIVIEGALNTQNVLADDYQDQFGGHVMIHPSNSASARVSLSYVEFRNMGQAFQLGKLVANLIYS